jgi:hypothetical protein
MTPMIKSTSTEYKTVIEPIIKTLDDLDLCPNRNEKYNTTWDCNTFDNCSDCPFSKANIKVREALEIIKRIEVKL